MMRPLTRLEFGVEAVTLSKEQLEPYDSDLLHAEAMVFEPSESRTEAMQEALTILRHAAGPNAR
jgi:hypothetical protein